MRRRTRVLAMAMDVPATHVIAIFVYGYFEDGAIAAYEPFTLTMRLTKSRPQQQCGSHLAFMGSNAHKYCCRDLRQHISYMKNELSIDGASYRVHHDHCCIVPGSYVDFKDTLVEGCVPW